MYLQLDAKTINYKAYIFIIRMASLSFNSFAGSTIGSNIDSEVIDKSRRLSEAAADLSSMEEVIAEAAEAIRQSLPEEYKR